MLCLFSRHFLRRAAAVYTCCSHNYLFILFGTVPKKKDHEIPKTTDYLETPLMWLKILFNILESTRYRVSKVRGLFRDH